MDINLSFNQNGLIPVTTQSAVTGKVLMQAFANAEAVSLTLSTGYATYYSRSRKSIWKKGETSGNRQKIVDVQVDCDEDSLLYMVEEEGSACHTGRATCFYRSLIEKDISVPMTFEVLRALDDKVLSRKEQKPAGSYVTSLFEKGSDKIIQKVGEEAIETVIALKNRSREEVIYECADLVFHLMVALVDQGIHLKDIEKELAQRYK